MEANRQLRLYLAILLGGWAALAAAGVYYARLKGVPTGLAWPIIAAFLVEYAFYLIPGFERLRQDLRDRVPVLWYAGLLAASAVTPYLIYSLPTSRFSPDLFLRLSFLVLFISYWFVFRRPSRVTDLMMLFLLGSILMFRFFPRVYLSPIPDIRIDVLGQLMLIRLAATVFLTIREEPASGFGFIPGPRDWKTGVKWFLLFLPVWLTLGLALGVLHFSPNGKELRFAPLVFLGFLWVVALSEEFAFRGLLQRWIGEWTGRPQTSIVLAAAVFGLSHLGFGRFPNYKFALLAAIGGWFYGKAFAETGSLRTSMVAHALTVTVWRTLF